MPTSSPLCQLNGGCMGCCGYDFVSKEKIEQAIGQSTKEFELMDPKTDDEFRAFRDRRPVWDLKDGVCRNLVQENGCNVCPLHPARHKGKDLREGHCDVNYLCKTAKAFENWSEEKQQKFVEFVESKNLDNISYSMLMDKNQLLEEFEQTINTPKISPLS